MLVLVSEACGAQRWQLLLRLQSAHVRFLSAVYVKTEVKRLYDEFEDAQVGFWSKLWTGPDGGVSEKCTSLSLFLEHVQRCWQLVEGRDVTNSKALLQGNLEYVFDAVLPMLW